MLCMSTSAPSQVPVFRKNGVQGTVRCKCARAGVSPLNLMVDGELLGLVLIVSGSDGLKKKCCWLIVGLSSYQ